MGQKPKLYNDLCWIWNLWGDPDGEYADFCKFIVSLIDKYGTGRYQTLIDIGCGGGKNIYSFRKNFQVTGVDISPAMLRNAKKLNSGCEFIEADMRHLGLNRQFDVVFIDDAISHMTTTEDLAKVFQQAVKHLKIDGLLIVVPDYTEESFVQNNTEVFNSIKHPEFPGTEIVFIENINKTKDSLNTVEAVHVYLIRQNDNLTVETYIHILGLFSLVIWKALLEEQGLQVYEENFKQDGNEYTTFICRLKDN